VPLVSHQRADTVLQMLFSVYRHAQSYSSDAQYIAEAGGDVDSMEASSCTYTAHRKIASSPGVTSVSVKMLRSGDPSSGQLRNLKDLPTQTAAGVLSHNAALPPTPLPLHTQMTPGTPECTEQQQKALVKLNPLTLPVGAYLSMFSSTAEYTQLTRCHRTGQVSGTDISDYWVALVRYVSEYILNPRGPMMMMLAGLDARRAASSLSTMKPTRSANPSASVLYPRSGPASMQRAEPYPADEGAKTAFALSGVYVHRMSSTEYELGIVTPGDQSYAQNARHMVLVMKLLGISIPFLHTTLPIGAALRGMSLKVWWTPQASRVTPGTRLAPVKLMLEDVCGSSDPRPYPLWPRYVGTDDVETRSKGCAAGGLARFFRGYEVVSWFLMRPVTSQLRGTRDVVLPHRPASCAVFAKESEPPRGTEENRLGRKAFRAVQPHYPAFSSICSDEQNAPPSSGSMKVTRLASGHIRATLWFSDLSVTTTGEHMLAVEVRPAAAFQPFVPTLCDYVTPFLVVPLAEVYGR
jgi:hypothetical protein